MTKPETPRKTKRPARDNLTLEEVAELRARGYDVRHVGPVAEFWSEEYRAGRQEYEHFCHGNRLNAIRKTLRARKGK